MLLKGKSRLELLYLGICFMVTKFACMIACDRGASWLNLVIGNLKLIFSLANYLTLKLNRVSQLNCPFPIIIIGNQEFWQVRPPKFW